MQLLADSSSMPGFMSLRATSICARSISESMRPVDRYPQSVNRVLSLCMLSIGFLAPAIPADPWCSDCAQSAGHQQAVCGRRGRSACTQIGHHQKACAWAEAQSQEVYVCAYAGASNGAGAAAVDDDAELDDDEWGVGDEGDEDVGDLEDFDDDDLNVDDEV